MANYGHIIIFSLLGGVVSLLGGVILLSKRSWAEKLATYATPFAAGALLAAVFLDLLHEGVSIARPYTVLLSALIGMVLFFFAERFLRWFHHHHEHEEPEQKTDPTAALVIAGDTLHNVLDGVVIAASFLVSVPTGIITTIAVAAHEIPQEIGDFGLLLKKGMRRRNVLIVNLISALATVAAAVVTFWLGSDDTLPIGVLLGLSAGFLLYIAASDIIPTIHEHTKEKRFLDPRPFLLLLGVVVVGLTINLAHRYIDGHDHDHDHHPEASQSIESEHHGEHDHDHHDDEDHGDHDH